MYHSCWIGLIQNVIIWYRKMKQPRSGQGIVSDSTSTLYSHVAYIYLDMMSKMVQLWLLNMLGNIYETFSCVGVTNSATVHVYSLMALNILFYIAQCTYRGLWVTKFLIMAYMDYVFKNSFTFNPELHSAIMHKCPLWTSTACLDYRAPHWLYS